MAERLLGLLHGDDRVLDAVALGSLAAGDADAYSDVDLAITVRAGIDLDAIAGEWVERVYAELPVLHHFEVAFGGELVRGFLLDNLLEIDLGFSHRRPDEEEAPGADLHAAEAGFAWHDVLHAAVALRRGRPWRALFYVERLRTRTVVLAAARLGLESGEYKGVDDLPREVTARLEESLVASPDPDRLRHAARAVTRAFFEELRRERPDLADRLEPPLLSFLV